MRGNKKMDRNEKEKKMLYEWGEKNHTKSYFQVYDKEKTSYFIKRGENENSYIREYGFESLPEIVNELDALWQNDAVMEHVKKVIGIASLKNKPSNVILEEVKEENGNRTGVKTETENKLPVFIYNF